MKNLSKVLLSVCLCLALVASVLTVSAFAAEDKKNSTSITLEKLLGDSLYVEKNKDAGLRSEVKVALDAIPLPDAFALYLPGSADTSELYFSWKTKGVTFSKDGKTYKSGKAPIAKAGERVTYTVSNGKRSVPLTIKTVQGSKKVDAMFLEIDESKGSILAMQLDSDHETSCYGKMKVGDHKKKYVSIKGRGNSTWLMPKKPYNFTVYDDDTYCSKDKTELVKGEKAKKWSLLANYYDNSLMRNKIAQDLASDLGIGLQTKFVDLWMNGTYLGNYLLTPKKDHKCADDGYVLENDNYEEEEGQFAISGIHEMAGNHNLITVREIGDEAVAAGVNYKSIEKWFKKAWAAALDYESEDYQNYFDLDSWAKLYLMYEVSKTYSCYSGSLFMHRDGLESSDKLKAGPAWDYDIAFGRTLHKFRSGADEQVQVTAEGWYIDNIGEYGSEKPASILQALGRHTSFMEQVSKVYNDKKTAFEGITANIDRQKAILKKSATMNNDLFGTNSLSAEYVVAPKTMEALGTGKYKLNYKVTLTWDDYIHNLREYCNKRVMWLSDHLAPGVDITTYHGGTVSTK